MLRNPAWLAGRAHRRFNKLERAKGIEPSYEAWEASVLPLNYARAPRPGKPYPALAGEARLELATPGFGDRCSAN
jgi:hypothetical protein